MTSDALGERRAVRAMKSTALAKRDAASGMKGNAAAKREAAWRIKSNARAERDAGCGSTGEATIDDRDFAKFQELIRGIAGINLSEAKKALLCGRLGKRLRSCNLAGYGDYYALVTSGRDPDELQTCVDLLTTNETYFFREDKHFEFLERRVLPAHPPARKLRVWSAACSSGEEPYSIAMVLADVLDERTPWEVLASDISSAMLRAATAGLYRMERGRLIPRSYLERFCLKGIGSQAGHFLVGEALRRKVGFAQINLNAALPEIGEFDVIFLRNVMIYFETDVKRRVIERLVARLKPGGWLLIGHSETLNGVNEALASEAPTIYRKPL